MKAMVIHRFGGPEVFELGEFATPRPAPGEILVQVHGSSVNPLDCGMRAGMLQSFRPLPLPAVLGVDVAGEVVELGEGSTRFTPGDRVFAYTGLDRPGGYGELIALPESFLARVPATLDWTQAGTVPGVGASAYEALTVHAPVQPGMRVFINGGAGGVGTYAIQVAKALGAEVTVTASVPKAALLRDLGADHVIDYTTQDPVEATAGNFDVVLNAIRGSSVAFRPELLRPGGVLVTLTGGLPEDAPEPADRTQARRVVDMIVSTSGVLLEGLAAMIEAGQVRPVVERAYGWEELPDAHRRVEIGRVTGKVAVVAPQP